MRRRNNLHREVLEAEVIEVPPPAYVGVAERPSPEPPTPDTGDKVVAVATAITVTSIAVLGVLNFLADDDDDPPRRRR